LRIQSREGRAPDAFPDALVSPEFEATPDRSRGSIAAREVLPATAAAKYMEDAFQGFPVIGARPSSTGRWWQQGLDNRPLGVRQVYLAHAPTVPDPRGVLERPVGAVLYFAIEELGVRPLRPDWEAVLAATEAELGQWRAGG
jgi:hypothetical protein